MKEPSLIQEKQLDQVWKILDSCAVTRYDSINPSSEHSGIVIKLMYNDKQYLSDTNIDKLLDNGYIVTRIANGEEIVEENSQTVERQYTAVEVDQLTTGFNE